MTQSSSNLSGRQYFLDGLRGWAALIVMMLHVFFGSLPPGDYSWLRMGAWWPFSGSYMVGLFFMVSGFALSFSYLKNGDRNDILRIIGGRYFRLLIPVLTTCAFVSALLNFGLFPNPADRTPAYASHYSFQPTLWHLFSFAFYRVFFEFDFYNAYAGPLWTMSYELLGSYAVLALLLIAPRQNVRLALCLCTAAWLLYANSFYALFFMGVLAAEFCVAIERKDFQLHGQREVGALFLIAGYFLPLLYSPSGPLLIVAVALWFLGSMLNPAMRSFLSSRFCVFLGTISFSLYLVHEAMIVAIGMPIYVAAESAAGRMLAGVAAATASVALAIVFTPINTIALVVSRGMGIGLVRTVRFAFK